MFCSVHCVTVLMLLMSFYRFMSGIIIIFVWVDLGQSCPTGSPCTASGQRPLVIRPATTLQRTLFTDL